MKLSKDYLLIKSKSNEIIFLQFQLSIIVIEKRLPDSQSRWLPDSASRRLPSRRVGESMTPHLAELTTPQLAELTTSQLGEWTTPWLGEWTTPRLGEWTTPQLGESASWQLPDLASRGVGEYDNFWAIPAAFNHHFIQKIMALILKHCPNKNRTETVR